MTDATIYAGHVMHLRLRPKRHQFRYGVWSLLLDVDRLAEIAAGSRLFRLDRFGIVSLHLKDHGPRDGTALRPWVEDRLAESGLSAPARIRMLAMPRILGYAFNPLTTYFCEDADGRLESLVYQVKNTFGDQIAYALPAGEDRAGTCRQTQEKGMFVSPFIAMEETYRFTVARPADRVAIRIRQGDASGDTLIATHNAVARPFSDAGLARHLLTHPMVNLKVIAGIHWEAARLAMKGVRFLGHPGEGRVFRSRPRQPAE
jgi:uncharacterized protein